MVLVRSAFWLSVAYFAIGPRIDYGQSVDELSSQALIAGRQLVVENVNDIRCDTLECAGARMLVSASLGNRVEPSISNGEIGHSTLPVVVPRPMPRLQRTG